MKVWTVIDILKWTINFFEKKGIENPRFETEYILSHSLNLNRLDLYLKYDMPLSVAERDKIKKTILRRLNKEPLQYIFNRVNFFGYNLYVDENVLIPRPETEYLVDRIINENRDINSILEIGTGSGAIAIALKKSFPQSNVIATDISDNVLSIAKQNAANNEVKIDFIKSDIYENVTNNFDIIVSNPPYISAAEYETLDKEVKKYEPEIALKAPENGLYYYKSILNSAKKYLKQGGKVYFEIGYKQAEEIKEYALTKGFQKIEIDKDLNEYDRYMKIQ